MSRKRLTILGSTGSIGEQTLEIVAEHADRLQVVGLAAHGNWRRLTQQAREFGAAACCLVDGSAADHAAAELPGRTVLSGEDGLVGLLDATDCDLVVAAISGGAGLRPLAEALRRGLDVALANKEPLVMAGAQITELAAQSGSRLLPVDSELSAIFQCLEGQPRDCVSRILLTASGGPFSGLSAAELAAVTPEQALRHPTWRMGRKVTIDSATLANKGFELYEVRWLFGVGFPRIEVVVHHQSIVHSLVEFHDSSALAQLGRPDMRLPIQYALFHPERVSNTLPRLELAEVSPLTFASPDVARFPCLRLAREAAAAGGGYPAVLNGADEAAVALFLDHRIGFAEIPERIDSALEAYTGEVPTSIEDAIAADAWARSQVMSRQAGR